MTIDPPPSRRQLEKLYRERTGTQLPDPAGKAPRRSPAPAKSFVRMLAGEISITVDGETKTASSRIHIVIGRPVIAQRDDDALRLVLPFPPRTKKNSKPHYARQSSAYRTFHKRVDDFISPIAQLLLLPLPDRPYNIAAVYYVDKRGELADRPGLDQGLHDALQDAQVVTNDWFFRTTEGTRIVFGDPSPRVELLITPIP